MDIKKILNKAIIEHEEIEREYKAIDGLIDGSAMPQWHNLTNIYPQFLLSTLEDFISYYIPLFRSKIQSIKIKATDSNRKNDMLRAAAMQKLLHDILDDNTTLYTALRNAIYDALKYSIGVVKVTWKTGDSVKEYYDIENGKVVQIKETETDDNILFEHVKAKNIMFYPAYPHTLNDIEYVIEKKEKEYSLDEFENKIKYNKRDEVSRFLSDRDIEGKETVVYEVWSKSRFYIIAKGEYILADHPNPYKANQLPYFFFLDSPKSDSIFGWSTAIKLSDLQVALVKLIRDLLDNVDLSVHKAFIADPSSYIEDDDISLYPGKIIKASGKLTELQLSSMGSDIYNVIAMMQGFENQLVGNINLLDSPAKSVTNKTATGAKIIASRVMQRANLFATDNLVYAIKPMIDFVIDMIEQFGDKKFYAKYLSSDEIKQLIQETAREDKKAKLTYTISDVTTQVERQMLIDKLSQFLDMFINIYKLPEEVDKQMLYNQIFEAFNISPKILKEQKEEPVKEEKSKEVKGEEQAPQPANSIPPEVQQMLSKFGIPPEAFMQKMNALIKQGISPEQAAKQLLGQLMSGGRI